MRDLPFSATIMFIAIYIGASLAGALFAVILGAIGLEGFWGIFLAAFLAVPIGNTIRYSFGQFLADRSDYHGKQPSAFNFPIRMAIGGVVAAIVAMVFDMVDVIPFNAIVGSLAALLTMVIISLVFYLRFSLKG